MITHGNLVIPNDTVIATCREQKPGMFCLQRRAASPQVGIQNRVAGRVQRSFGVAGSHWHLLKVSKITCTIHAGRSRFQSAAWKVVSENGVKIPFKKQHASMCCLSHRGVFCLSGQQPIVCKIDPVTWHEVKRYHLMLVKWVNLKRSYGCAC